MLRIPNRCYLLYKYHIPILGVASVATLITGYLTLQLPLKSDFAALLPDRFESVKAVKRMEQQVGGSGELRIVLETQNFAAARRLAEDLEPRLLASPLVKYVDYKNDLAFYQKHALLFLDTAQLDSLHSAVQRTVDRAKRELNPLFVEDLFADSRATDDAGDLAEWEAKYRDLQPKEFYSNTARTVLVMKVFPSTSGSDLSSVRQMANEVRRIVASVQQEEGDPEVRNVKIYFGGSFQNRLDEYDTVRSDILGTALYGFGGIFLLIVLYFRRFVGAVLITISLLYALSWTFGVTYLAIGQLNMITGFLFVILFGLGIDYGIHVFARYVESRKAGLGSEAAIEKAICQTGTALATTAITTAGAFFSLTLMDFKGFSDLGFISGVGILFSLLAMIAVLPAFILVAERIRVLRIKPAPSTGPRVERRALKVSKPILLIALPLTVLAAYLFGRVDFEYDFTNLRAITREREIVSEKTEGVFTLSESPAVILADTRQDLEDIVAAVKQTIEQDTLSPTIETVQSVFSLVPDDQAQRLRKVGEIRNLVEDQPEGLLKGEDRKRFDELKGYLEVDEPFTWDDFPTSDKRQFIDKSGEIGNFVFIYPSVPLRDGRNAIEFRNDVGKIATNSGKIFYAASPNIISAEMLLIMIREGKVAVALTFVVVFLIVLADFRSLRATFLVLSPLVVGVLWMGGLMYLVGMKLNFFNVVVFPSVLGIGVDNGVHIYHRYREEGPGSLRFVLRNTGLVILMATLTTIVGYSGLIAATHPGLRSIGDLAVIGLSTTFLAAVVVLPALLQLLEKRRKLSP